MHIVEFLTSVKFFSLLVKVAFKHIDILFVRRVIHSRVTHNNDAKFMKACSHLLTLKVELLFIAPIEISLEVDNWNVFEV